MAQEKVFPMTQAGKQKLEQELEHLKTVVRKEVVERAGASFRALAQSLSPSFTSPALGIKAA